MNTVVQFLAVTLFILLLPHSTKAQLHAPPKILTITPDRGLAYEESVITLEGENFQANSEVFIADQKIATIAFFEPQKIIILLPAQKPGGVDLTLRNPDGQEHTVKKGFHYVRSIYEPVEKELSSIGLKITKPQNRSLKSKLKKLYITNRETINRIGIYAIIFVLLFIVIFTNRKKKLLRSMHEEKSKK